MGKLIIGYTADKRDYVEKAADFFSGDLCERQGKWRAPNSNLVENFGLPENLMVTCAVTDVTDDFEAAVRLLVRLRREAAHLFR